MRKYQSSEIHMQDAFQKQLRHFVCYIFITEPNSQRANFSPFTKDYRELGLSNVNQQFFKSQLAGTFNLNKRNNIYQPYKSIQTLFKYKNNHQYQLEGRQLRFKYPKRFFVYDSPQDPSKINKNNHHFNERIMQVLMRFDENRSKRIIIFNFITMRSLKESTIHEQAELAEELMDEIENSLVKGQPKKFYGIDEFEKVFEKKKIIINAINEYHDKNKQSKQNIIKVQQRLYQIQQLADRAEKQGILMRNQIDKINDAHMMTKILTIQKMIKAKIEHQEMEKRKNAIFRIREERHRTSLINRSRNEYKTEKIRQLSLLESKNIKDVINEKKYETIEEKRVKTDKIKQEKQRMKDRLKRYEQFRIDQARKNYSNKMQLLKEALEQREHKLEQLYKQQVKQQKNYETTQHVTKEYLGSLFPTQTI